MSKNSAKTSDFSSYKFDTSGYIVMKSAVSRSSETGQLVTSTVKDLASSSLTKSKK
jgi:hypothetical protein